MRIVFAAVATVLMLGACASPGSRLNYEQQVAALEEQCRARDGMLQQLRLPTDNAGSDFACRIRNATALN